MTVPGWLAAEGSEAAETWCSAASRPTTDSPLILAVLSNTAAAAELRPASSLGLGPLAA